MTRLVTDSAETLAEALGKHFVMWHELPAGGPPGEWRCQCGQKFGFSDSAIQHQTQTLLASGAVRPADERWNTAVDWLLNAVDPNDFAAPFWAFYDGIITEDELRSESVFVDEINTRRAALAEEGGR